MRMKKIFTVVMTSVLISVLFVMPVSAHGHHEYQGHHSQTTKTTVTSENTDCTVCTVDGCTETGRHSHDGHDYCGYHHESGYCDGSCEIVSDKTNSCNVGSTRKYNKRYHCHS